MPEDMSESCQPENRFYDVYTENQFFVEVLQFSGAGSYVEFVQD